MKMIMQDKNRDSLPDNPRSDRRSGFSGTQDGKLVTGHGVAGNQAPHGKYATGRSINLRKQLGLGTWNVRGLLDDAKLQILENEIERCNMSITGISETHWKNSGHRDTERHTIFFSGNDKSSHSGVAIAVPKRLKRSVLGYNPVSDRIISMKLNASPTSFNIIQVYAPTSSASEDDIEMFYNDLETCMNKIPKRELLIIIGDFNAKVGTTIDDSGLRDIVGKYGHGVRNSRGERLIDFAANNNLTIMNTVFQHHVRRLYTWISPDGKYRNQIDYIIIRSRWRSSVTNVHTLPGADCHSDHQLLVGRFRLKLHNSRPVMNTKRMEIRDKRSFTKSIVEKHNSWLEETKNVVDTNSLWLSAKQYIKEVFKNTQPIDLKIKRQHWMSVDTWKLVEDGRRMKASGSTVLELNRIRATIQTSCRRDRNVYVAKLCEELENHAKKFETRDLHAKIRYLTRQFKPKTWAIENTVNITVTEIKDIVTVWKDYCKALFSDDSSLTAEVCPINCRNDKEPVILKDEVRAAIHHLKHNKAVGVDEMPIEVFKIMGESGVDVLHTICCNIWETGVWPAEWSHSLFIPLHKKGSTKKCHNYRLISLISHASKVMLHILNTRLRAYLSPQIAPEQAGFVKGKGTREQILVLRQIIEKAREFNTALYICFVDFRKAFDTVKWTKLWQILSEMGVPFHLIYLVQNLYVGGTAAVRLEELDSESFKPGAGVRQGCILSPLLFNIYTEYIMRIVLENWDKGISVGGQKICNLRYADDTTLLAQSKEDVENLLTRLEVTSLEYGLTINREKTKMMIVDRSNQNRREVQNIANCEVVETYVYLGSTISNNGGCELEIRRRCAITRSAVEKLNRIWKDKRITKTTKVRLMRCLVFPIFLYGAETWSLRMQDRRKIDALEMWCWRRLLKIPWTAFRTNTSILKELKITERLSSTVQLRILKFFGHVTRNENSIERLVVQGQVEGKRSRGRSPTRWTDVLKTATKTTVVECSRNATNRQKWRDIAREAVRLRGEND